MGPFLYDLYIWDNKKHKSGLSLFPVWVVVVVVVMAWARRHCWAAFSSWTHGLFK